MKIAIVGAGIIGVTTAYELAADGHEVTVFERRGAAAEEASFANAGVIAPGDIAPWAAPVRLTLPVSGQELAWLWKRRVARKSAAQLAHRARMQALALYSRARLRQLTADLELAYDRSEGYLVMLRSEKERRSLQPGLQVLRDGGVVFSEISADQARAIEPAINPDTAFLGAIHLPDDEVGNCRQFALLLKGVAQDLGVRFEFNSTVAQLDAASPASLRVATAGETMQRRDFHAVVVCGGADSARLLRPLGLRMPLAAVHGYSISAPIREPLNAPRSGLMDHRFRVAVTRLGNRVRVAGSAEIGGRPGDKRPAAIQTLYRVLHDWFPGAAQLSNTGAGVQEWKGARPMLPDGPPLLGATGIPGVWINLGHGSSGWALSCGSARAVADLMAGRPPALDIEGLGVERLLT